MNAQTINFNPVRPDVHRSIFTSAIRRFLEQLDHNVNELAREFNIDLRQTYGINHLFDRLLSEGILSDEQVDSFLLGELMFGKMKNVYISFIENKEMLNIEENIISRIRYLSEFGYKDTEKINTVNYIGNLRAGLDKNEKKVLYFNISKNNNDRVSKIEFLLAEGFINSDGESFNYYIPVELNLELEIASIRFYNFSQEKMTATYINKKHKEISEIVETIFSTNLVIPLASARKIVTNILRDFTDKVLFEAVNNVNNYLTEKIKEVTQEWYQGLFGEEARLSNSDHDVLTEAILNSYYKHYVDLKYKGLTSETLRNDFKVDGYARYVKFKDDSIGEGKAKSSTSNESLLDTSVFYDIKARLDQSKQILLATFYWINIPDTPKLGTSFHTDSSSSFRYVVLQECYNEVIHNYVLQKINEYYRESRR